MSPALRIFLAAGAGGAAAAALTFLYLGSGSEPPTWLIAVAAPLVGMGTMHFLRPKAVEQQEASEEEEPPSGQLVGKACAVCEKRIKSILDADPCEDCGAPLHDDCIADHTC